jgi:uncharacterized protein YjbK
MPNVSFTIPAPPKANHAKLRLHASKLPWVRLHTSTKPGHVAPPDAGGLEYDYQLSSDDKEILINTTENPHNMTVDQLRPHVEAGFSKLAAEA